MYTKRLFFLIFLPFLWQLYASDSYSSGLSAYREGRDGEAQLYLEKALEENPGDDGAYLYLGILYQKAGLLDKAEQVLLSGSELDGNYHYELVFNLANLYHNEQRFEEAEEKYSYVSSSLSPLRTKALLNKANMAVNRKAYQEAIDDYLNYLLEEPDTPQRGNIEKMVALLRQQFQDEERQRLEEEAKIRQEQEEQQRQEEEEALRQEEEAKRIAQEEENRQEEEARQRALMEDILNSLSSSGEETTNFTADSEKVEDNFEESDLED